MSQWQDWTGRVPLVVRVHNRGTGIRRRSCTSTWHHTQTAQGLRPARGPDVHMVLQARRPERPAAGAARRDLPGDDRPGLLFRTPSWPVRSSSLKVPVVEYLLHVLGGAAEGCGELADGHVLRAVVEADALVVQRGQLAALVQVNRLLAHASSSPRWRRSSARATGTSPDGPIPASLPRRGCKTGGSRSASGPSRA